MRTGGSELGPGAERPALLTDDEEEKLDVWVESECVVLTLECAAAALAFDSFLAMSSRARRSGTQRLTTTSKSSQSTRRPRCMRKGARGRNAYFFVRHFYWGFLQRRCRDVGVARKCVFGRPTLTSAVGLWRGASACP